MLFKFISVFTCNYVITSWFFFCISIIISFTQLTPTIFSIFCSATVKSAHRIIATTVRMMSMYHSPSRLALGLLTYYVQKDWSNRHQISSDLRFAEQVPQTSASPAACELGCLGFALLCFALLCLALLCLCSVSLCFAVTCLAKLI